MKLIDGHAMIQRVEALHKRGTVDLSYYNIVKEAVQMEPAVDAVPVAHGRWECLATEHNAYWWMVDANCSCCGFVKHNVWSGFFPDVSPAIARSVALRYASRINLPRYCESCGARMDGDTSADD